MSSSSLPCNDFLPTMDMEETDSWGGPDDASSIVCSVSASSVAGSVVEVSSSSISGSVAEASSECSDTSELLVEPILVNNEQILLPSDLCTNSHLLKNILSIENVTKCIPAEDLENLLNDLPNFPKNNLEEKRKTFHRLLSGKPLAFGSNPITDFIDKLKDGHYHADVVETTKELRGSLEYLQKIEQKKNKINLLTEAIVKRNTILQNSASENISKKGKASIPSTSNILQKGSILKRVSKIPTNKISNRFNLILSLVNEDVGVSSSSDDSEDDESSSTPQSSIDLSEVDLEIVNPTLMPSQNSQNECFSYSSHQVHLTDKAYCKLLKDHTKRTKRKKPCPSNIVDSPKLKLNDFTFAPLANQSKGSSPHRNQHLLTGGQLISSHQVISSQEPRNNLCDVQSTSSILEKETPSPETHGLVSSPKFEETSNKKSNKKPPIKSWENDPVSSTYAPNLHNLLLSSPVVPTSIPYQTSPNLIGSTTETSSPKISGISQTLSPKMNGSLVRKVLSPKPTNNSTQTLCPNNSTQALSPNNSTQTLNPNNSTQTQTLSPKTSGNAVQKPVETPKQSGPAVMNPLLDSPDCVDMLNAMDSTNLFDSPYDDNYKKYLTINSWPSMDSLFDKNSLKSLSSQESITARPAQYLEPINEESDNSEVDVVNTQSDDGLIQMDTNETNSDVVRLSKEQNKLVQTELHNEQNELLSRKQKTTVIQTRTTLEDIKAVKKSAIEQDLKRNSNCDLDLLMPSPKRKKLPSGYKTFSPATLSDLDGLNMMDLPIQFDESSVLQVPAIEAVAPCPTIEKFCLFSLIRDIICSNPYHRMTMEEIKTHLHQWAQKSVNQQSPYNTWEELLQPAVGFMAGEYPESQPDDFVPFIEYKSSIDTYQWIGAGRDTDNNLILLSNFWKQCKNETRVSVINPVACASNEAHKIPFEIDQTPPSRYPTSWTVRPCTPEERKVFHLQEKERFDNPHKTYVYKMHGYESVVGPLRGIFSLSQSAPYGRGGRDHCMLVRNRPTYITILALVRDAVARLPNGQGTRGDVCTLLQDSQYLNPTNKESELNTIVSGALDRLHSELDPCVRYDQKRKIWLYLHRNRTEQEFEKLHKESQGKKQGKSTRKARPKKENATQTQSQVPAAHSPKGKNREVFVVPTDNTSTIHPVSSDSPSVTTSALPVNAPSVLSTLSPSGLTPITSALPVVTSAPPIAPAKPQSALQKALTSTVATQPDLLVPQHVKDLAPDLRSHILKLQKKQLEQQQQNQLSQTQQQEQQSQQTKLNHQQITSSPLKISTSTSTETYIPPPIYTSCVAAVTTTASIKTDSPSEGPQPIKLLVDGGSSPSTKSFETIPHLYDTKIKTKPVPSQQAVPAQPVPVQIEAPSTSKTIPISTNEALTPTTKTIPISSAPMMEMLKGIGANQLGSSRVVLVKAQGQSSLIQDGRKPIMILKQKGSEDGKTPQQVYFIDDKTIRNEPGLSQLLKQQQQLQQQQQQQQKHQSQASQQGVQKILSQAVSASSQSSIASSTESSDSSTQNSQNTETSQSQTLSPGHVITSSPGQFTQFGVAATARQGTKKINLTPTQQKQLQQLLFTKPQLVKAGNQQSINQLKQVLFLKTGVISKLNKSGKAEEQTILCQNPLSADANLSQMIIVKQQDPNSNQLIGEPITNEQVAQLQMAMKHHQKTMARLKKKDTTPSSSATQTKTTTSVMSSLPPGTLGPPPPYTMTETKLISSVIEASTQISGQHTDQQQPTAHLQLHVANNASKEDQQKISSAGVTILTQSKPVMAQGFKPQHGQIIARVLTGATGSRTVISSGDTKSIPVSFTTTPTRVSSPASTKPDSIPVTSQASSPEKQNFPVNIKHQVVGKFVTGGQNQQILVQNQAGLLKNGKNQPLVAKFVTQGSHNAHMIKVLSHPQGAQPFIGKISTGGANSKPIVAKITNAQGQPIYSMEDLFSQSNKAGTTCFRIASSPTCNSKPQKIVASLTPPTQSVMQDQLLKHPNILIKPQQCALSPQLSQGSPRSQLESQKPIQQQLTNQQITAITSQAQAQLQQLSPNNASHSSFGKEDANVSKSQQQNLFTTQYVQTISNQTTGCASQQKIQVALSQADNTQLHQYLQNNQILTQVPNKIITSSSAATPQLVRMVPAGSLKNLGGNPFILTGAGKTQQSTVLDPQQITSQSSILLSPQALQTTNGRTLTLVQQGNGQPLLLPSNFQGGTLNIKTLQGMKVIPFSQNGRQQVLARIVPPPVKTSQVAPTVTTQKPNIVENGDLAPT